MSRGRRARAAVICRGSLPCRHGTPVVARAYQDGFCYVLGYFETSISGIWRRLVRGHGLSLRTDLRGDGGEGCHRAAGSQLTRLCWRERRRARIQGLAAAQFGHLSFWLSLRRRHPCGRGGLGGCACAALLSCWHSVNAFARTLSMWSAKSD